MTAQAAPSMCEWADKFTGDCTSNATNDGNSVEVSADWTTPGRGGSSDRGGGWDAAPGDTNTSDDSGTVDEGNDCTITQGMRCGFEVWMPETPDIPEITLTDVAVFAPQPPAVSAEPAGVGIVGMPVNFVVHATTHTVSGELFDFPLQVRFSPISYGFSYGDGTNRHATTGGATWPALGQPQFTATPTSHAYPARGTYTAHVTIGYTAAVDLGSGWFDLPGTLELTSAGSAVEILELHTALVERTCVEDPAGPGC